MRSVRVSRLALACFVASMAASMLIRNDYYASVLSWMAINVLIATTLRFVLLSGELNFATGAFVGLGAYGAGVGATLLGMPFVVNLMLAALVAGALGLVFGWITLRTKGPYFLLIGFAFTEVVRMIYSQSSWLGGNSGMVGIYLPQIVEPYFPALIILLVSAALLLFYTLEHSDFGLLLTAIRQNDGVVEASGINVHVTKVLCFALAATGAGLAGGLQAHLNGVISPGDFGFLLSAFALAYVKVGGESFFAGPIVGAALLTVLATVALGLGTSENIVYGATIVAAVLALPRGLVGLSLPRLRGGRRA